MKGVTLVFAAIFTFAICVMTTLYGIYYYNQSGETNVSTKKKKALRTNDLKQTKIRPRDVHDFIARIAQGEYVDIDSVYDKQLYVSHDSDLYMACRRISPHSILAEVRDKKFGYLLVEVNITTRIPKLHTPTNSDVYDSDRIYDIGLFQERWNSRKNEQLHTVSNRLVSRFLSQAARSAASSAFKQSRVARTLPNSIQQMWKKIVTLKEELQAYCNEQGKDYELSYLIEQSEKLLEQFALFSPLQQKEKESECLQTLTIIEQKLKDIYTRMARKQEKDFQRQKRIIEQYEL